MTANERRAQLRAAGYDGAFIEEMIADQSVGGVWCDGTVVLDASGRRCVTRATRDRVLAARDASPLDAPAPRTAAGGVAFLAGVVVAVGLVVALER